MPVPQYVKPVPIKLQGHSTFNERWVQDRIAEDPSILGLGNEVWVKDKERMQWKAGRLDFLLHDTEEECRYEVELQLGATDESHIIRCIEYYDYERRRDPQFNHCAVLVAEDVTSRFLNVVSLFNGFVPIIAIQMRAIQIGDTVSLVFTRVVNKLERGIDDKEATEFEPANREYWEHASAPDAMAVVDGLIGLIRGFKPNAEPNYTKGYIGVKIDGLPKNFVLFNPQRGHCRFFFRLPQTPETDKEIEDSEIVLVNYETRSTAYKVRLGKEDITKHKALLTKWLKASFDYYS